MGSSKQEHKQPNFAHYNTLRKIDPKRAEQYRNSFIHVKKEKKSDATNNANPPSNPPAQTANGNANPPKEKVMFDMKKMKQLLTEKGVKGVRFLNADQVAAKARELNL